MKRYNFIKTMVLFAALSGNVLADLNDGLVAYYPFNGDAKDASGNGNDGTVNGATLIEDRFGSVNSAYQFDGKDDYILVAHNSTLNATPTGFTISTWIKAKIRQQNALSVIIEKSHTDYEGWVMQSFNIKMNDYPFSPGLSWGIGHKGTPDHNRGSSISGLELFDDQWHYLTGVFDGTTIKFYSDGILISNKTYDWIPVPNTGNLYIGNWWHGSRNFGGVIDDIRIYNRALTENEVMKLFREGNSTPPVEKCTKAEVDAAYEAGRQACIKNPESCGISTDGVSGGAATYSLTNQILHIPAIEVPIPFAGTQIYKSDMKYLPSDTKFGFHFEIKTLEVVK